jgi:hypothetical protein
MINLQYRNEYFNEFRSCQVIKAKKQENREKSGNFPLIFFQVFILFLQNLIPREFQVFLVPPEPCNYNTTASPLFFKHLWSRPGKTLFLQMLPCDIKLGLSYLNCHFMLTLSKFFKRIFRLFHYHKIYSCK